MGGPDVSPASSPWQRAGNYFRCCEVSGLMRVSVLLPTLSARLPLPLPLPLPRRRRDLPLRGREGAVRRMPPAWAGVTERPRDAPRFLGRAWGPRGTSFPPPSRGSRVAAACPRREGSVCVREASLSSARFAVLGCGFLQVGGSQESRGCALWPRV
ncbi:unnamed protein product [Pipistrellus nathusii]|uniref:Uncharacterized protein n=1 Tax=Pipistrellus nathusii TaxID=59473 RepID=A0ABP0AA91_PIPNA